MKPHPRIRKTIKWGGAAVTVLLIVAWIAAGKVYVVWKGPFKTHFAVISGRVSVGRWAESYLPVEWPSLTSMPFNVDWRFNWHEVPFVRRLAIPLWAPTTAALLFTAIPWALEGYARRLIGRNICVACRYDRTGLAASAVCPECGHPKA